MFGKIGAAFAVGLLAYAGGVDPAFANDMRYCELEHQNPDRSIAACTRMLQRGGGNSKARAVIHWHRGNAWWAKREDEKALEDFEAAVRLDPRNANALLNAAVILGEQNEPDRALSYVERAMRVGLNARGRRVATRARANAYFAKRSYDQAVAEFTALIRLAPEDAYAYARRGEAHEENGDIERALADYAKALDLDPKYVWVHNQRGLLYLNRGELDKAIADFDKAIALNPKTAWGHYDRGRVYLRRGEIEKAQADFTKAIENDPTYHWAYRGRAEAFFVQGDYAAAVAALDQALERRPRNSGYLYYRGAIQLFNGAPAKALADLNAMSELDPTYVYGALMLDIAARRNNVTSRLGELTSKIDMTQWPAPLVRLFLGQLSPDAALAAAEQVKERTAVRLCETRYYAGALALLQEKRAEALPLFKQAARECPRSEYERDFARAELRALGETP